MRVWAWSDGLHDGLGWNDCLNDGLGLGLRLIPIPIPGAVAGLHLRHVLPWSPPLKSSTEAFNLNKLLFIATVCFRKSETWNHKEMNLSHCNFSSVQISKINSFHNNFMFSEFRNMKLQWNANLWKHNSLLKVMNFWILRTWKVNVQQLPFIITLCFQNFET